MSAPPINLTELGMKCRRWRVVRICVRDSDATDSSSDEEGHRVRKFVKEITTEEVCRSNLTNKRKSRRRKNRSRASRNQRPWGTEIRDPLRLVRLWLGAEQAAIQVRGPHALTNSVTPPPHSSASALHSSSFSRQAEFVTTAQSPDESFLSQNSPPHSAFDSIFPNAAADIFDFQTSFPRVFDNTNVPENSYILTEQEDCSHILMTSSKNMDVSFSSWHRDDFFRDMADFPVLDPIVSLGLD